MGRYSWLRLGSLRIASSAWIEPVSHGLLHQDAVTGMVNHLLYYRKNPRLCVIVSVGANDKIDFFVRGILTKRLSQTEERIFWSGGHNGRGEDGRA